MRGLVQTGFLLALFYAVWSWGVSYGIHNATMDQLLNPANPNMNVVKFVERTGGKSWGRK